MTSDPVDKPVDNAAFFRSLADDPARDARRAAYAARERVRASRAMDRYLSGLYGELFDERYGTRLHHNGDYGVPPKHCPRCGDPARCVNGQSYCNRCEWQSEDGS